MLVRFLNEHLPKSFQVRCQAPIAASPDSEPEPDIAVIPAPTAPLADNPQSAILAVEVSHTTLARDRAKAAIYAAAGVREYWIINIPARTIEQYTQPRPGIEPIYATRQIWKESDMLQCAALPLPPLSIKECLLWT